MHFSDTNNKDHHMFRDNNNFATHYNNYHMVSYKKFAFAYAMYMHIIYIFYMLWLCDEII